MVQKSHIINLGSLRLITPPYYFMCLSFSAPPPVSRRRAMSKQQCGKAPASLVSMAARADATHPRAPQGSVSSSRGRLSAAPSCFCLSVLNHPGSKCAAAALGLNSCAQNRHVFLPDRSARAERGYWISTVAASLWKQQKAQQQQQQKRDKKTTGCVVFCSFAFDVI